eukprot:TRINITY_DN2982_c0_g1_i1.p1 TRINITY_DN2982_c0_g1~~TRINITY_DN2982_c0_g1_i1.p1  ORF type:complete len:368 (-),score=32.18 TRINITY_DN2982_c0_g1_i1:816-1919(-)
MDGDEFMFPDDTSMFFDENDLLELENSFFDVNYLESKPSTDSVYPSLENDVGATPMPQFPLEVKRRKKEQNKWTKEEHTQFFEAIKRYGRNFEKISKCIRNKSQIQVRQFYYRILKHVSSLISKRKVNGEVLDMNSLKNKASLLLTYHRLKSDLNKRMKPQQRRRVVKGLQESMLRSVRKQKNSQGESVLMDSGKRNDAVVRNKTASSARVSVRIIPKNLNAQKLVENYSRSCARVEITCKPIVSVHSIIKKLTEIFSIPTDLLHKRKLHLLCACQPQSIACPTLGWTLQTVDKRIKLNQICDSWSSCVKMVYFWKEPHILLKGNDTHLLNETSLTESTKTSKVIRIRPLSLASSAALFYQADIFKK